MDTKILRDNHQSSAIQRLFAALVPALLISLGYVDPGKWAATVEGGARFGSNLVLSMCVFNFAAILCHYLSAQIGVVTGRDLSQICSEEYDKATCVFLGVLIELSMVALDLTLILGTAHMLNLLFGVDLFTCVFLAAMDAVLHHVFASFLNNGKAKFICIPMASFLFLFYVLGVLFSQPEISISTSLVLTKLSGESAFALMTLLGASIMPYNFYLQSSIVQHDFRPLNVSRGLLNHDHFFAILCVFSAVFLVNFVFMNAAANAFYSTGLGLLTFQDALSLMDQLYRSSAAPFAILLLLFVSSQLSALTWTLGRQAVLLDFLGMDIPGWLHHATIRIIAIIPALYCVWNLGAEGMYQLLLFTQVLVALALPSSVIPLFRVASSKPIMGVHKISQFVEFLCLIVFVGMLGLKIMFLVEMIFGDSDWVDNLRWNTGSSVSVSYIVLIMAAFTSLCLMLWLAATPLKSATFRFDIQMWDWDLNNAVPKLSEERDEGDFNETKSDRKELMQKQESPLVLKSLEGHPNISINNRDLNLPETLLDSDTFTHFTSIQENDSDVMGTSPANESDSMVGEIVVSSVCTEDTVSGPVDTSALQAESSNLVEKTVIVQSHLHSGKDEGDLLSSPSVLLEGPRSFRSLSGKTDESGSGSGSLSRLAGLGRAGRRQLAAYLDEFWGQLFDLHGHATQDARAKKLDVLLGVDSKVDLKPSTSAKGSNVMEFTGSNSSLGGRVSDSPMNSTVYNSSDTSYGVHRGPSASLSSRTHLDAYMQNYSGNAFDSSERRYSSLRLPSSYGGNDHQPATVHGYQLSYLSQLAKQRASDILNSQVEALTQKPPSLTAPNYKDPPGFASGRKVYNGLSTMAPPGFLKPVVSRNISLQSKTTFNDGYSHGPAENLDNTVNEKKFYSSPDISRLSLSYRNSYLPGKSAQWESPIGYGSSLYPSASTKAGAPLVFNDISASKMYTDGYTSPFGVNADAGSLFSKQPFEQFGVADKPVTVGSEAVGCMESSLFPETTSVVGFEAQLLQSFRHCIVKLSKLEGCDWLFRQNDGADEDLIDRVAAREIFILEAETREMNRVVHRGEFQFSFDMKTASPIKNDETDYAKLLVSSVPHCGDGCVWGMDLIISFGVWCIHRILELSLMESRPELWGKYTYVLNRLQGIIDLAFSKPRTPLTPCFCLQIPAAHQQRSSPPISNGSFPPPHVKQAKGKCTSAAMLLEMIKDVEIAISCRKGRSGTAAGDVAFPKGKENLASVLKRYKRRLSNKPVG